MLFAFTHDLIKIIHRVVEDKQKCPEESTELIRAQVLRFSFKSGQTAIHFPLQRVDGFYRIKLLTPRFKEMKRKSHMNRQ